MNLISKFFDRRKSSRAQAHAKKIFSLISPFIDATGGVSHHALQRGVGFWDFSNPVLINYLGYVAGVIDAADYTLGRSSDKNWSATEIVFHQIIEAHLDWIDGVEPFIEVNKIGIECGGSVISVLQENPLFMTAMQLGGNDFLSAGQVGFFPQGLFKLRLIAGGSDSE